MNNLMKVSAAIFIIYYTVISPSSASDKLMFAEDISRSHLKISNGESPPYDFTPSGYSERKDVEGSPSGDSKALSEERGHGQPDLTSLKKVVDACRRALLFFRTHLPEMNLDAVIGTRIAEGQFKMVWNALNKKPKHSSKYDADILGWMTAVKDLHALYVQAEELNSLAQPFIRSTRPEYYAELGGLLQPGFWEIPLSTKIFNATENLYLDPHNVLNGVEQLVESQSDRCVSEAGRPDVGYEEAAWKGPDAIRGRCSLTKDCWDLMTKLGYSGYSLTHQVFYVVIGLQAGCESQLERFAWVTLRHGKRMTIEQTLEEICYSILGEANAIAEAGFPETRQDLFMEQGALCGVLGYRDFFKKQWLTKVLSWQRPTGCFGDFRLFSASRKHPSRVDKIFHSGNNRVKREESPMESNCLAHRTAVALGYLSLYVRWLAIALFT
ncbi:UPF0764 protein C16orf89 homolog isoform X38 [Palaemon carinicauda]|uniref:UPF0764 protein C16orf89 homolog isoform X38 n=1 Tax=Palaemon carinicauda TaxID=392227 RepID=UPI0035B5F974